MRYLPNLLTALRLLLSPILLLFPPAKGAYLAIYALCGVTDVLDGFLARHFHVESVAGARLDSAANFLLTAILLWTLWPVIQPGETALILIGITILLRFGAAVTARIRFGRLGFLHTMGNKLTGALLFLYPFSLPLGMGQLPLILPCSVALLTAAEELIIELTSRDWRPDCRGWLFPEYPEGWGKAS